jgi:hypothetical protein
MRPAFSTNLDCGDDGYGDFSTSDLIEKSAA